MSTETDEAEKEIEAMLAEVDAQPWPRVVKLRTPIEFGDETITELAFQKGKMGDARGLKLQDEIPTNDLILIASRLCGRPTKVLDMLDIDDAGEVTRIAMVFYVKFLKSSKKRSPR